MTDLGDRIKERRKELGLTQIQLAERLGLTSKAAISTVEHNKEDMTLDRVERYAKALHTTPAYLMGWSDSHEHYRFSGHYEVKDTSEDTKVYKLDIQNVANPTEHELKILEAYRKSDHKDAIDILLGVKDGDT